MRLRIDELAQRSGVTSRNIRAYQARGLLPPPELEGRTGYYGEVHLRRLELIAELQERGFSLEAIRQTLDAWSRGGDLSHLIGIRHVLTAPFDAEEPRAYELAELLEAFGEAAEDPALIERAVALGLLEPADDGRLVARSPMLVDAGRELVRAGVPLAAVLDMVAAIKPDIADIAERFIGLVHEHVMRPITDGLADPERVGDLIGALDRLRPIAVEVVRPFLAAELRAAIERTLRATGLELSETSEAS